MVDYAAVLGELRSRRDVLERECRDLDTAIAAIERLAVGPSWIPSGSQLFSGEITQSPPLSEQGLADATKPYDGMTMPQAVIAYFNSVGPDNPRKTRQVLDAMIAGGMANGANARGHVYNTLDRMSGENGQLRRHEDGSWSLKRAAMRVPFPG